MRTLTRGPRVGCPAAAAADHMLMMDVLLQSKDVKATTNDPARTGLDVNMPESLSFNVLQAKGNLPWTLRGRTDPSMSSRKTAPAIASAGQVIMPPPEDRLGSACTMKLCSPCAADTSVCNCPLQLPLALRLPAQAAHSFIHSWKHTFTWRRVPVQHFGSAYVSQIAALSVADVGNKACVDIEQSVLAFVPIPAGMDAQIGAKDHMHAAHAIHWLAT